MGETAHILRIVVASPGDVQAECACLPAVIDEINRDIARDQGLRLELARWETDAYPGFHPEGPQGLIDPILRVDDCDVLIGIFWKRFGTPTMEAQSGTEHEFRRAYAAWQQCQRPHIMMYFNHKPYSPQHPDELDQWKQVLAFKQHFPKEGLWWAYTGKTQFERLVRRHLTQFLRHRQATATPPGASPAHTSSTSPSPALSSTLRSASLPWVVAQVRAVPLTGADPKGIHGERGVSTRVVLTLPDEVYQRAERLAQLTGRAVADALADVLALFLPSFSPFSTSGKPVTELTDEEVLALTALQMTPEHDETLSALLHSQQAGELADNERAEMWTLLQLYQEGLLRKAQALHEAVRRGLHEPLEL